MPSEAWPYKITKHTNFECTRCKRDKLCPKKFSKDNNMIPSPVPLELQNRTQCEEVLIYCAFPVMQIWQCKCKCKSNTCLNYKGYIINLPHNIQNILDILPNCPKDITLIFFSLKAGIFPSIFYYCYAVLKNQSSIKFQNSILYLFIDSLTYISLKLSKLYF